MEILVILLENDRNKIYFQSITLHFAVLSFDRFSRDDVIGEVLMPLQGQEFYETEGEMMMCKEIQPRHMKVTGTAPNLIIQHPIAAFSRRENMLIIYKNKNKKNIVVLRNRKLITLFFLLNK